MTDNDIIKALECCSKDDCDNCPNNFGNCYANLAGYALDLINRQQAEIEAWKNEYLRACAERDVRIVTTKFTRAEAVKEFAEKLNDRIVNLPSAYPIENVTLAFLNGSAHRQLEILEIIDNLVKEMVGEGNA